MGRVGTHMAVVSSGWGPSGRRFKSGLPDDRKPAGSVSQWTTRHVKRAGEPTDDFPEARFESGSL